MRKLLQRRIFAILRQTPVIIILLTILWRAMILVIPLVISSQINKYLPLNLNNWNRWDAPHYLYIAANWYTNHGDELNFIVFPPFYPIAVSFLNLFLNNLVLSGVLISNIFFIAASLIFYNLVKDEFDKKTALRALVLLNVFPTSYFFSIPYAESLFFFLIVLSFYYLKKNKWFESGIAGSLSILARTMGIIFLPTLLASTIISRISKKKKLISGVLIAVFFAATILSYLAINWFLFKDALAFKSILENHWYKHLAFPWESIVNSFGFTHSQSAHDSLMLGYFEAIPAILGIILIPLAIRKLKFQYWLFYDLSIIFITSTSFLLSTPRYFLSIPPFFMLLGVLSSKRWIYYPLIIVSVGLLTYFSLLFVS